MTGESWGRGHKSEHECFAAAQVSPPVGKGRWEARGQSGLSPTGASRPFGSPDETPGQCWRSVKNSWGKGSWWLFQPVMTSGKLSSHVSVDPYKAFILRCNYKIKLFFSKPLLPSSQQTARSEQFIWLKGNDSDEGANMHRTGTK